MNATVARTLSAVCALAACVTFVGSLGAQTSETVSFLLVPTNARSVGLGGAGVADPLGTSALFVNPAAFARLTGRAVDLQYGVDQSGTRVVASATAASRILGSFGVGAYRYSLGSLDATDSNNTVTGRFSLAYSAYAASYGVAFTRRFTVGVTAKLVQFEFNCTGICAVGQPSRPATGAVDAGAQLDLGDEAGVHVGAVLRNFGLRLQNKDRAQADPLPTQVALGVGWDLPHVEQYLPDVSTRLLADVTHGIGVPVRSTIHLGAEATYKKSVSVRAGYAHYAEASGYGGLGAGFGVKSSRLTLDVGRQITTNALLADKPPTYVGLRYSF